MDINELVLPVIVEGADPRNSAWRMLKFARATLRTKNRVNTRAAILAAERYLTPELVPAERTALATHLSLLLKLNESY